MLRQVRRRDDQRGIGPAICAARSTARIDESEPSVPTTTVR
ncbi:hypothetical protein BZL30_8090 [Mycobacterium kansasii]|uniref:Uncharacterized protein n=1 Tax=Mycobacterium kansasii TaxID=1768 RepID=A0A1V3WJB7_MYCKA|nr:hypothetical protein BZL30_8090 [Mycobacterium kansasii]